MKLTEQDQLPSENAQARPRKLIAPDELPAKGIHYSRTQLWRREKAGTFPKRVRYGDKRFAYVESEIDDWIDECIAERDAEMAVA